jgi:hypothetical protein
MLMSLRRAAAVAVSVLVLVLSPSVAHADVTAFLGSVVSPSTEPVRGVAVGVSLLVVGFEFEYAQTPEDVPALRPSRHMGTAAVLVQTPFGRVQLYGALGVGLYREQIGQIAETGTSVAGGVGAKITLSGPLRLRVDYRLINLNRSGTDATRQHRIYAGLNLVF